MDSWERFDETLLSNKEDFYSSLNIKDTTDIGYRDAKRVFKDLEMNNLGDYHDLYLQRNTSLLAGVFANCSNKGIAIVIMVIFISTWINMQAFLKNV